jgi:hypothetical protein
LSKAVSGYGEYTNRTFRRKEENMRWDSKEIVQGFKEKNSEMFPIFKNAVF